MEIENLGKLKKLEIKDIEIFKKFYDKYPIEFCDYNLFNLFSWSVIYNYLWMVYKDRLIIYNQTTDFIFMPVGEKFSADEILFISESFKRSGCKGSFCFFTQDYFSRSIEINNQNNDKLNLSDYFEVLESRDNANYIYTSEKLSELKGRKFHNKRNLISQFIKNYPTYQTFVFNDDNLDCKFFEKCVKLAELWLENKKMVFDNDSKDNGEQIELRVIKNSCNYFKYIRPYLSVIEIKGEIVAFSVFSMQTKDMVTIHFEKYNDKYIGASQTINNFTAKYIKDKYIYINREDDLGIPQLRFSKSSYHPDKILSPYLLIRK